MFIPKQIVHLERLFEKSQSKNRKGVEIVLIMGIKEEVDRLVKNGLNFRYIKKSVLYFQEADLRTICYRCCKIGHEKSEIYENKFPIYKICGKNYYINNYTYNILIYKVRKKRKYLYDLIKCGNYINIG